MERVELIQDLRFETTTLKIKITTDGEFIRNVFHGLVDCGGENGVVQCFYMRMRTLVGRINAIALVGDVDEEVTTTELDENKVLLLGKGKVMNKREIRKRKHGRKGAITLKYFFPPYYDSFRI
ncbi:hypothetical protein V6N12_035943 [Hibiscus sabdariffa]|uniref:Uncharacterized protein n=1 Tax=Hibiscus sabdariffa TaxID=183260 RepID=A0ABR2ERP5_9ROSI